MRILESERGRMCEIVIQSERERVRKREKEKGIGRENGSDVKQTEANRHFDSDR